MSNDLIYADNTEYFKNFIAYPFNSTSALAVSRSRTQSHITDQQKVDCPILILHARDDDVIPHHHSSALFHTLTESNPDKVEVVGYEGWGNVSTYKRHGGDAIWWDGWRGGHNDIGWAEGSVDLVKKIAGL